MLLFIPAQTLCYWNGWLFIGLLFIPMFIAGIVLIIKDPDLLRRRLNTKEKQSEQKIVVALSSIMFISGFIIAGLNYKYGWYKIPNIVVIISSIVFFISDTGLYSIVRHPMYIVTTVLFLMIPLILGSIISFIIFLIYPIIIIKRIKNEEQVLEKELNGYIEYKKKVKYRLIPFIW